MAYKRQKHIIVIIYSSLLQLCAFRGTSTDLVVSNVHNYNDVREIFTIKKTKYSCL